MKIDPWSSQQYKDYARLRDEFGIEEFDFNLPNAPPIFRRKVIFGHRGFQYVYDAIIHRENFAVLTGLMPSGKMHFGHKMTIEQVKYYQSLGADVNIAVADIEAYAARGLPIKTAEKIALEEYVPNYIALGLDPERTVVYFQSKRSAVKDVAWLLGKKVNLSEFLSIYGFGESTNMAHIISPLVQVGDILHVQFDEYGGRRPTVVPVGVDQDPHMRLTRDIVSRFRLFSISPQKEGMGVFYKGDDVEKVLKKAREYIENYGFSDFSFNIAYKALYVKDATDKDLIKLDKALIDCEHELHDFGFYPPAATYHRLMTGLTGGKMSSSKPESAIFLTDSPQDAKKKMMRAKTGGRVTLEEQRKLGGEPGKCAVYEMFVYHLVDDDEYLKEIYETCKSGERICGKCKKEAAELVSSFLKELAEKRNQAKDYVKMVIRRE